MLTLVDLPEMHERCERNYWKQTRQDVRKLLDFAEIMLPIRDALLELLAAEEKTNDLLGDAETIPEGSEVDKSFTDQDVAHKTLWKLARELGKTNAEVEP